MFHLGWGENGETWNWWRRLLAWEEEMLEECKTILHEGVSVCLVTTSKQIAYKEQFMQARNSSSGCSILCRGLRPTKVCKASFFTTSFVRFLMERCFGVDWIYYSFSRECNKSFSSVWEFSQYIEIKEISPHIDSVRYCMDHLEGKE